MPAQHAGYHQHNEEGKVYGHSHEHRHLRIVVGDPHPDLHDHEHAVEDVEAEAMEVSEVTEGALAEGKEETPPATDGENAPPAKEETPPATVEKEAPPAGETPATDE